MSAGSSTIADPVIRILLIGRDASGKSSSGNKILGKKTFKVHVQQKKNAAEDEFDICEDKTQIGEKQVAVIDCLDLLDPDLNEEQLKMLKEKLVSQCSAGLSSVLLVVPLVKHVQNEEEILYYIKCLFGPEVQKYIMILFTHEDVLEDLDQTIDEHLQHKDHADLQQLVTKCGEKFHCFNNKNKSDDQVQELLQKIQGMTKENGGKFTMRKSSTDTTDVKYEVPDDIQIPERKDLRLVLLGKTGSGKSAAGNTIIGRKVFDTSAGSTSQTKQCQLNTRVRMGRQISVIDTPGLYDTNISEKEVITETVKCLTYASPGPHAFIIVIKVGRFTEEEKNTIKQLKDVFGETVGKYSMILFTHKDQLEKDITIEQYLQESGQDLKNLIRSCENRFFFLDNDSSSFPQFSDLISKIEMMVEKNGHFTNDAFEDIEKRIREVLRCKLHEKVEQLKQIYKFITQTEWQKIFCPMIDSTYKDVKMVIAGQICLFVLAACLKKAPEGDNMGAAINVVDALKKQKMCVIQ